MAHETIIFEQDEGVAVITLNRSEARNALDLRMRQEIADLIPVLRDDASIKAVLIIGAGGVFCSGGDLRSLTEERRSAGQNRRRIHDLHVWLPQLVNLEKPVVAAVDGPAFGGGFNLALVADFILATPKARFCQVFARIGMIPDLAGLYLLPRIVGLQRAKELVFTGRVLGAEEARTLGIVHDILPAETLRDEALAFTRRFCAAPTMAIGLAKNILNQSHNLDQRVLAELESYAQAVCLDSEDHRNAVERFLRKEPLPFVWEDDSRKRS